MSQISGIVQSIEQGTVQQGHFAGNPYWTVTLSTGTKLTAFEQAFISNLERGKEYTFTIEAKGSYVNIVGNTVPVVQTAFHTPQTIPPTPVTPTAPTQNKDVAIAKAVAIKAAVEFVSNALGGTANEKDVLTIADKFLEWLT